MQKKIDWMTCIRIFLGVLLINSNLLIADWNPEYCFIDEDIKVLEPLKTSGFKSLKEEVIKSLANSWCSSEKANLMMDLILITRPKVCVEIGAFTGSSILPVATTLKYLNQGKVYAIDAWSNDVAIKHLASDDPNRNWWASLDMKEVKKIFLDLIQKWSLENYCVVIQSPSNKAVRKINQIDFLHIDGDYSEKGSLSDVKHFLPKVKPGGYILFSNLFTMIQGKQPRLKAFVELFQSCEMICEIERENAILFKKP